MNDSKILQIQKNFIFRAHHRRLCSPPFCSAQLGKNFKRRCDIACERINVTFASETCSNLVPAIKTIRFTDFRRITDLVLNNYDARIVFLVRDPRSGSTILTIQPTKNRWDPCLKRCLQQYDSVEWSKIVQKLWQSCLGSCQRYLQ